MLSNAYLARASTAIIVLSACGCLVMSGTGASAANGAGGSGTQTGNVLTRAWHALFRSSSSLFPPDSTEGQAEAEDADADTGNEGDEGAADSAESGKGGKGDLFRSDPQYETSYNAQVQVDVYGAKKAVEPPRPLLELGRQQYTSGAYEASSTLLGEKNPLLPGLSIYGDWRTALAYNKNNGKDKIGRASCRERVCT